jgi:hypothetical protein
MALLSSTVSYGDMKARLVASAKDEDITAFSAVDKLLGYDSGRLSVNSRLDLAMQDADLEPLIVQVRSSSLANCPCSFYRLVLCERVSFWWERVDEPTPVTVDVWNRPGGARWGVMDGCTVGGDLFHLLVVALLLLCRNNRSRAILSCWRSVQSGNTFIMLPLLIICTTNVTPLASILFKSQDRFPAGFHIPPVLP